MKPQLDITLTCRVPRDEVCKISERRFFEAINEFVWRAIIQEIRIYCLVTAENKLITILYSLFGTKK